MRKHLRTNTALLILVLILGTDAYCMASRCVNRPIDSTVGGFLSYYVLGCRTAVRSTWESSEWVVHMTNGQLTVEENPVVRGDRPPTMVGGFRISRYTRDAGWHAPSQHRQRMMFYDLQMTNGIPTDPWQEIRDDFIEQEVRPRAAEWKWSKHDVDHLLASPRTGPRQTLSANRGVTVSRILPLGIAHDAITLTTLFLLIWSIRLNLVRWRKDKRLRAAQCPNCRYSIVGLPTNTCPECGQDFCNAD